MCRIVGIVSKETNIHFEDGLKSMLYSVAHGGPDDEGTYMDGGVGFGHRRLSIIDLSSAGHQPMLTPDAQLVISFNGEIYNYQELRDELAKSGVSFKTRTDTEVILQAYKHWGTTAFNRFEGIFAFSLYDKRENKLFLVRDHIGVKPLYYFLDDKELIFASEVRAFKALRKGWPENENWKILFLAFGSLPHPHTTLAGVLELAPGSCLELQLQDFKHQVTQYYKPNEIDCLINTNTEALQSMQLATRSALRKNLISDAPLGIFLSGGIDSSFLALLADKIQDNVKTISVNFDEAAYDEHSYQKLVLEKTKNAVHTAYRVTDLMFWESIDDIWAAMDQPSIDGVNSYFTSKCAKADGLKVVLSGLGADEIFGGYQSFKRIHWLRRLRHLPLRKIITKLLGLWNQSYKRFIFLSIPGAVGDYLFLRGLHTPDVIAALLGIPQEKVWAVLKEVSVEVPEGLVDVEYATFLESKIYMTNQLLKDTDYMGMWHGLEVRVPFLDIELINHVESIAPSLRYKELWPKYLLTASNAGIIPHEIIFREKKGFTFPFAIWIKNSPKRFKAMLLKGRAVDNLFNDFQKGNCHWSKVWSLAVVQAFTMKSSLRSSL